MKNKFIRKWLVILTVAAMMIPAGIPANAETVEEGENIKCHACGWPLTKAEAELPNYELGVSCVYCIEKTSDAQKAGFRMRQSQIAAAKRKRL